MELAAELTQEELSGTVPLSWPLRFGGRLEELYLSRVRALPADTRELLLVAAADQDGDPEVVYKGAAQLGAAPEAGEAAGTSRLVSWQPRVRVPPPMVRSGAYYAAPPEARRRAPAARKARLRPRRGRRGSPASEEGGKAARPANPRLGPRNIRRCGASGILRRASGRCRGLAGRSTRRPGPPPPCAPASSGRFGA